MKKEEFMKLIESLDADYRNGISEIYLLHKEGKLSDEQEKMLKDRVNVLLKDLESQIEEKA